VPYSRPFQNLGIEYEYKDSISFPRLTDGEPAAVFGLAIDGIPRELVLL